MADILEEIVAYKRQEVAQFVQILPLAQLARMTERVMHLPVPSMRQSLMQSATGIIAEFKRKSPSKGWIHREARVSDVAPAYQQGGASALSILTDREYFGGYDEYIQQARFTGVTLPILYKNFIVDEYQLFQARYCGASAVLLIAAVLSVDECRRLMQLAHQMGMEVLLEMHSPSELDYAALEPDMYGVNNRHLGTFHTDVQTSFDLVGQLPDGTCRVSESGLASADTIRQLRGVGYRGFLIGETFMKQPRPGEALSQLVADLGGRAAHNIPDTDNH